MVEALTDPGRLEISVLVIDDEQDFAQALCRYLSREGYITLAAYTAQEGLQRAQEGDIDVALVDMRLPDLDGVEVCRHLRDLGDMVLIALSVYDKDPLVAVTEEIADAWMVKPIVHLRELSARIRALYRRSRAAKVHPWIYHDGFLYIDPIRRLVKRDGERVELSPKEFSLLSCLLERRNQIVARDDLLRLFWQAEQPHRKEYLIQYIARLRQKLERRPEEPFYIRTARGLGYWFCCHDVTEPIRGSDLA